MFLFLLKEIAKYEHGNFIVSPISVESILAFTREGAKGETADEFKFGLHLPSTDQKTQYAFKYFLPNLKRDQDDLKIWSANKLGIKKAFHEGADFSGISASDDNFSINDVIQKTYISFDEFGCEATSPTA
ncbi:hypothetical protein NQ314_010993, partial [Rhamnusium bicolor]